MISIIVPVLNEESTLLDFMGQFKNLGERDDFELIISDGGSSDGTVAVAQSFDSAVSVRVVVSTPGRAWQMNNAARLASGDTLLFLHADTYLPEGALRAIASAMQDKAVVGGRFKIKLDNLAPLYKLIGAMINLRDSLFGGFTGDQAIFIRKDVFEKIGGYKEIELCEDLDMARQLKREGEVIRLPLFVTAAARRWEKSGPVKTILLMWTIRLLFYAGVSPKKLAKLYADVR